MVPVIIINFIQAGVHHQLVNQSETALLLVMVLMMSMMMVNQMALLLVMVLMMTMMMVNQMASLEEGSLDDCRFQDSSDESHTRLKEKGSFLVHHHHPHDDDQYDDGDDDDC